MAETGLHFVEEESFLAGLPDGAAHLGERALVVAEEPVLDALEGFLMLP